jgi:myo-inositol-1(or 4)-monophosphatase
MKPDFLDTAVFAAHEAGKILMSGLNGPKQIQFKGDIDLVTHIDTQSENAILTILEERYPSHNILAEESGRRRTRSPYCWIIDPLDGTTNYAHNDPNFAVSIALEYRKEIVVGVVYDPTRNELFYAQKGEGAWLNGRRLQVTQEQAMPRALLATGIPYARPELALDLFVRITAQCQGIRRGGSAALDLAYTAAGRFDGFWELLLNPWDVAAGTLLVREAGGKTSDFDGNPYSVYGTETVATNGRIHNQLLKGIREITTPAS